MINIYFLIGVVEGDGSFYVGLRNNKKVRFGFNITTHSNEIDLLYKIKWLLNCGTVKNKTNSKNNKISNWCRYEVEGSKILRELFIPLIDSTGLLGSKSINFKTFKEVMIIYRSKDHLTDARHRKIVELIYNETTKKGAGRKLTLQEYLRDNNL